MIAASDELVARIERERNAGAVEQMCDSYGTSESPPPAREPAPDESHNKKDEHSAQSGDDGLRQKSTADADPELWEQPTPDQRANDPNGDIAPNEFADMVVDQFLYGFAASVTKGAAARRQHA